MIFLDTHVVVWLYARLYEKLSPTSEKLINDNDLYCSPMVKLELKYLFEINRITEKPNPIMEALGNEIGLRIKRVELSKLVDLCLDIDWTRDPFDRLIVAQALMEESFLLTRDDIIHKNFELARW